MKKTSVFLSAWLLLVAAVSVRGSQVYGTKTFSVTEGSREHDYSGTSGKRIKVLTFDIWNLRPGLDMWLELDSLVIEFFRYHNPTGTLKVTPTVATVADLTDIRLENTQGEVVAVGKWKTVLPTSWVEEVSLPGSMNQMVFESVQPPKRFRGETFFLSVVPGSAFVTDDVVGAGLRKVAIRNNTGMVEVCEPYPEWGAFVSTGTTIVNPAVLTVEVLPTTPKSVPAADNIAGARFQVTAKSIRPGNPMLWRGWQLEFEVPTGTAKALGVIKVLSESGEVVREETPILKGNNPRLGLVSFTVPDAGRSSGYSLKGEETLTVTFSTKAFAGADITITSVELLAADFGGTNLQYGDLVSSNGPISTTVHVQEASAPSGGGGESGGPGGGGGPWPGVPIPQEPPTVVDELPYVGQIRIAYLVEKNNGARVALWCVAFLENPAPAGFNRVLWDTASFQSYHDLWEVVKNTSDTVVAFRLPAQLTDTEPSVLQTVPATVRFFRVFKLRR